MDITVLPKKKNPFLGNISIRDAKDAYIFKNKKRVKEKNMEKTSSERTLDWSHIRRWSITSKD